MAINPQRQGARVVVKEKMLKFRQEQYKLEKKSTNRVLSSAERAARAQNSGYMRLLSVSDRLGRASEQALVAPSTSSLPPLLPSPPALSADELLTRHMAEVDAELLRWESLRGYDLDTMGTISLVDLWKACRFEFPLLYAIAMDILSAQASSVSSERAFSSGKMTCTCERNRISAGSMEILQVLKHSLHRR
ncbi:hypothetical protein FRC09_004050 [Ceratobasidium sp. 395]|nr:hypothetical protein FRC09_004050 [Ceratobasidium sp. 395]